MERDMPVDRCTCLDVSFAELKEFAERTGCGLAGLSERFGCGRECRLCVPYLEQMLQTGQTTFEASDSQTSP